MENVNASPRMLLTLVRDRTFARDPLTLLDVGCALGLDPAWRLFEPDLRAHGFDPQVDECRRLNEEETNPNVRYHAAFVGLPDDHPFHERRRRDAADAPAYFDPIARSSAYAAMCRTASTASVTPQQAAADRWEAQVLADEKIGVGEFVRRESIDGVDFVKIDTQGADLEVAMSCEDVIRAAGVLGFMIETWYTGSHHETENSFHNVDRFMKRNGFLVFGITVNRYSRAVLPAPFVYRAPYQTITGQPMWGDVVYMRDAGAPDYEEVWGERLAPPKLLKLACLLELFELPDCAAELLLRHRPALEGLVDVDELLDLLTPPLRARAVSFSEYVAAFEADPALFFPEPTAAADIPAANDASSPARAALPRRAWRGGFRGASARSRVLTLDGGSVPTVGAAVIRKVLELPRGFDLWQRLVGAPAAKRAFVEQHVRPQPGQHVLDIGCGTGALCGYMPSGVSYVGVDIDEEYIDAARQRFGARGEFVCSDVTRYRPDRQFDTAIAYGFFHHLEDGHAESALAVARGALHERGRLVASEPVRRPGQGMLEQFLIRNDRGKNIRTEPEWVRLVERSFVHVATSVVTDAFRVPYSIVIIEAEPA